MSDTRSYEDPQHPIERRVEDLLSHMTLKEKVGQMCQMDGRDEPEEWLHEHHIGSFLHVLGQITEDLQEQAERTRLGIPLLFGIDAIHGHAFWPTATVFPTQLALSCSWNPELVEKVGRITAKEASCTGAHWTFSPVLGVARDLRWGRIDETFGEDPHLVGALGAALVHGYQGDDLSDEDTILACAKHYAGYSETRGGRDATEADLPRRKMRSVFLQPFHRAAEAGCATMMAAYQCIDGVPCSANSWLLQEVLKEEWGFGGFVVSDWNNIGHMVHTQYICATIEEATQRAIEAGNDMAMSTPDFCDAAVELVQSGQLDEAHIDEAVKRILRLKFALGLFDDNRCADLEAAEEIIGCAEHREVALECAYQSIVLLKNEDGLLPLSDDLNRIAVIGPNADYVEAQLGDWVRLELMEAAMSGEDSQASGQREDVVTVLDGIRERVDSTCQVDYAKGCDALDPDAGGIEEAADLARQADIAIVVVGDVLSQNGERRDRADLNLSGAQPQLLEAVHATGTPMVVVLINGKPLTIPWVAQHAHAILEAWNPGIEGGAAVAGILFGDRDPSARLSISFPHHVGQQPAYYDQIPGWHGGKYVDMPPEPLFAFGYGLSYTTFACSNLQVLTERLSTGEPVRAQVDVENAGERAGTETVQLYVNDVYSSVSTPAKELKAFRRVKLQPGETKTVLLTVPCERLALVNADLETVVEPGEFEVMVGSSSRDQDLLKGKFEVS